MKSLIRRISPRGLKRILNLYPPYLLTGIRVDRIDPGWRSLDVSMRLRFYNRNALGTHFGGSLYAMVDPHPALLLMARLGSEFVVWDRRAVIDFRKPGRGSVHCHIAMPDARVEDIRSRARREGVCRPRFELQIEDEEGDTVASVEKMLHVRWHPVQPEGG